MNMKAIKFTNYLDAGGAIPPAVSTTPVVVGQNSATMLTVLKSAYRSAYIYLTDGDDISSATNSFCRAMTDLFSVWEEEHDRTLLLNRIREYVVNNNAVHEEVQQKRPPAGGTDFATAYTEGGTIRDLSGGNTPPSTYSEVLEWKKIYQPVLDLFRPLFHFAAPMPSECVEVDQ